MIEHVGAHGYNGRLLPGSRRLVEYIDGKRDTVAINPNDLEHLESNSYTFNLSKVDKTRAPSFKSVETCLQDSN